MRIGQAFGRHFPCSVAARDRPQLPRRFARVLAAAVLIGISLTKVLAISYSAVASQPLQQTAAMWPGVLLTGPPGIGKSTACRRVVELCEKHGARVEGFLTEEIREKGVGRVGFQLVGLGSAKGQSAPLARTGASAGDGPRVGKYTVALKEFEDLALPILDSVLKAAQGEKSTAGQLVCVIDEIGKMELFSDAFTSRMRELLRSRPAPSLVTVALRGQGLIAESKRMRGFELIELDHSNRDAAPEDLVEKLLGGRHSCSDEASSSKAVGAKATGQFDASSGESTTRWRVRRPVETESATVPGVGSGHYNDCSGKGKSFGYGKAQGKGEGKARRWGPHGHGGGKGSRDN
eukprot:TRINITY_DN65061_c0_g1_i1.p1 TRINITY_DN65061_c0_g1~~TRINITY_DN65061_c0_g1_i1.p1  ORF type:complete len:348 (+),score=66.76 TRINITY_DN65061_c0_g1_i1:34-1077(+)